MTRTKRNNKGPLLQQQTSADGEAAVYEALPTPGNPSLQRLWDRVDRTWTALVPQYMAMHWLRKVTFKCSACAWCSGRQGQIVPHIAQFCEAVKEHKGAQLLDQIGERGRVRKVCSGCGAGFGLPQAARQHLTRIETLGPKHMGATETLVMRYSVKEEPAPLASAVKVEPEASLANGAVAPRHRSRPRNRRKRHGHSNGNSVGVGRLSV